MTRSVNTDRYPEADYTQNDMGAIERSNTPDMWAERKEDGIVHEIACQDEQEKLQDISNDFV